MKKLLLLTAFGAVGFAVSATAADLPARAAPPFFAAVPTFTWTGAYVGVHAGYHWGREDTKLTSVVGSTLTNDVLRGTLPSSIESEREGAVAGAQAGYNLQFGSFVIGVEGDLAWTDIDSSTLYTAIDTFAAPGYPFTGMQVNTTGRSELEWLGTLRGRAGVAFDRVLVYATAGLAVGDINNSLTIAIPAAAFTPAPWAESDTEWGWAAGGGVEFAVTNNLSVKAEYLYYDLGDRTIHATHSAFPGQSLDYKFKNDGHIARAGVNLRF